MTDHQLTPQPGPIAATMRAIVTLGRGGYEQLALRDVAVPQPGFGEVLLQVLAAGINNTDINTRVGWYADGGWNTPTQFPLIQGADCCGRVVQAGAQVPSKLLDQRVLVRPCMRRNGFGSPDTQWLGTDIDGAFAQYVVVPATEVFTITSSWTDVELASMPCAAGTAENMIERAAVTQSDRVLITGASGGVGSAAVQLAKRRGAVVTALTTTDKRDQVEALGADIIIDRDLEIVEPRSVDVVIDNVAGATFSRMLIALDRRGRYVSSGAIAGPIVELDMRTLYLNDLTILGSTAWDEPVFGNVVTYIERDEIIPIVANSYPLDQIVLAQQAFLTKQHVGKLVLIPEH